MKHLNVKGYLISLLDELFVSLSVEESRFLVMLEFEWEADKGWTELSLTKVDRETYGKQERKITYALLSGAIILEIYSVLLLLKSDWSMLWLSNHKNGMANLLYKAISFIPLFNGNKRWSNTMGQYNLIRYCLKHKAARCGAVQRFLFHYEMSEKNRHQKFLGVSEDLKKLIFEQLLEKSKSASC